MAHGGVRLLPSGAGDLARPTAALLLCDPEWAWCWEALGARGSGPGAQGLGCRVQGFLSPGSVFPGWQEGTPACRGLRLSSLGVTGLPVWVLPSVGPWRV